MSSCEGFKVWIQLCSLYVCVFVYSRVRVHLGECVYEYLSRNMPHGADRPRGSTASPGTTLHRRNADGVGLCRPAVCKAVSQWLMGISLCVWVCVCVCVCLCIFQDYMTWSTLMWPWQMSGNAHTHGAPSMLFSLNLWTSCGGPFMCVCMKNSMFGL